MYACNLILKNNNKKKIKNKKREQGRRGEKVLPEVEEENPWSFDSGKKKNWLRRNREESKRKTKKKMKNSVQIPFIFKKETIFDWSKRKTKKLKMLLK